MDETYNREQKMVREVKMIVLNLIIFVKASSK